MHEKNDRKKTQIKINSLSPMSITVTDTILFVQKTNQAEFLTC